jgi:hypothetical protein
MPFFLAFHPHPRQHMGETDSNQPLLPVAADSLAAVMVLPRAADLVVSLAAVVVAELPLVLLLLPLVLLLLPFSRLRVAEILE